jgi:hypothetical protein
MLCVEIPEKEALSFRALAAELEDKNKFRISEFYQRIKTYLSTFLVAANTSASIA